MSDDVARRTANRTVGEAESEPPPCEGSSPLGDSVVDHGSEGRACADQHGPLQRRRVDVTTSGGLLTALKKSNCSLDLGGQTFDLTGRVLDVKGRNLTVADGTITCGMILVAATATNFCCRNLTVTGTAAANPVRQPLTPRAFSWATVAPLVAVSGARGVVFDSCTLSNCDNTALAEDIFGARTECFTTGLQACEGASVRVTKCRIVSIHGCGLVAESTGTTVVAEDLECTDNAESGALALDSAVLRLERSTISRNAVGWDFEGGPSGRGGHIVANACTCQDNSVAARVRRRGTLELHQCQMLRSEIGVIVSGKRSSATLSEPRVCQCECGVSVLDGATCTVRGGEVRDCDGGLYVDSVESPGSTLAAEGVVVRSCVVAVAVQPGATCLLDGVTIEDCRSGIHLEPANVPGNVTAVGVRIASCKEGLHAACGAVDLRRCKIEECRAAGVHAAGAATVVKLEDVDVTNCGFGGVEVLAGARVKMTGGESTGNWFGVHAKGQGSVVEATDVLFTRNSFNGAVASQGAAIVARSCALIKNHSFGVASLKRGSSVVLEDTLTIGNGEGATECDVGGGTLSEE